MKKLSQPRRVARRQARALRVAQILSFAEETFGDKGKVHAWLRRPNSALNGKRPIDFLDNETKRGLVEQLLHRIGHGIAA